MSRLSQKNRQLQINRRKGRTLKIKKLFEKYKNSKSADVKNNVLAKALKVNGFLSETTFLEKVK